MAALKAGQIAAIDADGTLWDADLGDEIVRAAGADPTLCGREVDAEHYFADLAADHEPATEFSTAVALEADPERLSEVLALVVTARLQPRRYLVEALAAAASRGVQVWVVSASPEVAVDAALAHLGLEVHGVVAARAVRGGSEPELPLPVGAGKVACWRQRGLPVPALAVGDSAWDGPLLAAADSGLFVLPARDDPDFGRAAVEFADDGEGRR